MKKTIIFLLAIVIFVLFIWLCAFKVNQYEYAIVTQFGKPVQTITDPGLNWKWPGFINVVNRLDRRIKIFRTQPIQLLLGDKNPIIVTCYLCWRIFEPLNFFESLTSPEMAEQKLGDMVNSQLGSVLGDYSLDKIINTSERKVKLSEIEQKIMEQANEKTKAKYGIEIVKMGINRLNYPAIVADAVHQRMRTEREKEAKKFRAEGREEAAGIEADTDLTVAKMLADADKQAEIIKGEGDREATRIYAEAYSEDEAFFEFMKSLETYQEILKEKSTLVLSTDSELFKYLDSREMLVEEDSEKETGE